MLANCHVCANDATIGACVFHLQADIAAALPFAPLAAPAAAGVNGGRCRFSVHSRPWRMLRLPSLSVLISITTNLSILFSIKYTYPSTSTT